MTTKSNKWFQLKHANLETMTKPVMFTQSLDNKEQINLFKESAVYSVPLSFVLVNANRDDKGSSVVSLVLIGTYKIVLVLIMQQPIFSYGWLTELCFNKSNANSSSATKQAVYCYDFSKTFADHVLYFNFFFPLLGTSLSASSDSLLCLKWFAISNCLWNLLG